VKKLRKSKSKKRERKAAQRQLNDVTATLDLAKECAGCGTEFDKAACMDWHIQVTAEGDVVLTCIACGNV
jgi:hypothetical protein